MSQQVFLLFFPGAACCQQGAAMAVACSLRSLLEAVGGSFSYAGGSELLPRLKEATSKDATITDKWNQKGTASSQTVSKQFLPGPILEGVFLLWVDLDHDWGRGELSAKQYQLIPQC